MNQIVIMGRLTRDPELRQTPAGVPVTSFSLAVDRGYTPRDGGERQTDFIDVIAWRNTAEFVSKYFVKGQMAAVHGRLQIRDWTDKENNKRRSAEVVAERIYFTESKKSREATQGNINESQNNDYQEPQYAQQNNFYEAEFTELDMDDGQLPF